MATYWYHPESESVIAVKTDREAEEAANQGLDEITRREFEHFNEHGCFPASGYAT